jgi:hypothetical protein
MQTWNRWSIARRCRLGTRCQVTVIYRLGTSVRGRCSLWIPGQVTGRCRLGTRGQVTGRYRPRPVVNLQSFQTGDSSSSYKKMQTRASGQVTGRWRLGNPRQVTVICRLGTLVKVRYSKIQTRDPWPSYKNMQTEDDWPSYSKMQAGEDCQVTRTCRLETPRTSYSNTQKAK